MLFRSLESEQLNEVLDAMFERKITPNEYIIKQGDDGDNFYVVERLVAKNILLYPSLLCNNIYADCNLAKTIINIFLVVHTTFS